MKAKPLIRIDRINIQSAEQDHLSSASSRNKLADSLIKFVPSPLFMLPHQTAKTKTKAADQYEFTFMDPILDFNRPN